MDAGELSYPCHAAAAGSRHEAYIAGDDERVYSWRQSMELSVAGRELRSTNATTRRSTASLGNALGCPCNLPET